MRFKGSNAPKESYPKNLNSSCLATKKGFGKLVVPNICFKNSHCVITAFIQHTLFLPLVVLCFFTTLACLMALTFLVLATQL